MKDRINNVFLNLLLNQDIQKLSAGRSFGKDKPLHSQQVETSPVKHLIILTSIITAQYCFINPIMASAAVQRPQTELFSVPVDHSQQPLTTIKNVRSSYTKQPRDVVTTVNYFKANEDGSPPAPTYVGKPETYDRPTSPRTVTVHDVRGSEDKFTLDTTGFQVVNHKSEEKDFLDDEHIKSVYYPEIEELLKKTYRFIHSMITTATDSSQHRGLQDLYI
jgi:hypothetical protein